MNNKQEKDFERIVKHFREQYEKAVNWGWVRRPGVYALYQTWKYFERRK